MFGDYLAAGAGAHGKISAVDGVRRYSKPANPNAYMKMIESAGERPVPDPLGAADLKFEFMLNALRLTDGFSERLFEERTGLAGSTLATAAAGALREGLITRDIAGRWQPTSLGQRFLNDLQGRFLP